jgi:hypothetical protein
VRASPALEDPQKETLRDFLERCDLVKFARHLPPQPELRNLWEAAIRLVDETPNKDAAVDLETDEGLTPPTRASSEQPTGVS